mgnify:CR=1 FL=1
MKLPKNDPSMLTPALLRTSTHMTVSISSLPSAKSTRAEGMLMLNASVVFLCVYYSLFFYYIFIYSNYMLLTKGKNCHLAFLPSKRGRQKNQAKFKQRA